jgi:hypothetical protein
MRQHVHSVNARMADDAQFKFLKICVDCLPMAT